MNSADYFKIRARVEKLRELARLNAPIESYIPNVKSICTGLPLKGGSLDNRLLFRSRPNKSDTLYLHTDELKYPSPEHVLRNGRLNRKHESVFYAAADVVATFIESPTPINRLFTISTIEKTDTSPVPFLPLGMLDGPHSQMPRSKSESIVIQYLNDEIRKHVPEESPGDAYNSTIAMGDIFLRSGIANHSAPNLLVAYPSAKGIKTGSTVTYNVAMTPTMFDKYYKITQVSVYCITDHLDRYILNEMNIGAVQSDGTISWRFDYPEMVERLRRGVLIDGKTNAEITKCLDINNPA